VVNILQSSVSSRHVDIVLEYCRGGDLWNYVKSRSGRPFREKDVLNCFADACAAVAHMHEKNIAHWDIKMDNILRASDGTFKLCDFGSCQRARLPCENRSDFNRVEELVQKYTSPIYRAPEMIVILNNSIGVYELTEKVDVWALGCVLYSVAYFVHPFAQSTNLGILGARYRIPDSPRYSRSLRNLIKCCLEIEVEDRVSSSELHKLVVTAMKGEAVSMFADLQLEDEEEVEENNHDDDDDDEIVKPDEKVGTSVRRSYSIRADELSEKEKQVADFATCSFALARRALIESEGNVQKAIECVLEGRVKSPRLDTTATTKKVKKEDEGDNFAIWSDDDSFFKAQEESTSATTTTSDAIWGVVDDDDDDDDDDKGDVEGVSDTIGFDDDFFS